MDRTKIEQLREICRKKKEAIEEMKLEINIIEKEMLAVANASSKLMVAKSIANNILEKGYLKRIIETNIKGSTVTVCRIAPVYDVGNIIVGATAQLVVEYEGKTQNLYIAITYTIGNLREIDYLGFGKVGYGTWSNSSTSINKYSDSLIGVIFYLKGVFAIL